ncbi:hypothetical protein, partial [Mesorhizobium sp. M7A.F.Ca.US.006.01.2.1]|uniref:hypothetical protein n=1 Tax=Mesorhizobium sp. M7A.F.Ca.US.006.01.2.1 TaxID=2496708 RepID=UPI0019D278F5
GASTARRAGGATGALGAAVGRVRTAVSMELAAGGATGAGAGWRNSGVNRLPSSLPLLPNMIDYRFHC